MTPGERLQRALELTTEARERDKAEFRRRFPAAGEREISRRCAQQWLGEELFRKVYGTPLASADEHA